MMMIKERADKDIFMYNIEIKELERIIAHECRLKEYMTTKCNERSGQDDTQDTGPSQCKCTTKHRFFLWKRILTALAMTF